MFIDSSNNFTKGKNQNYLEDSHLKTIMSAYKERKDVEKFAHLADSDEIEENDHNLNITRYVDTSEDEVIIDLVEVSKEIAETEAKIAQLTSEIDDMISQLVEVDEIPVIKRDESSKKIKNDEAQEVKTETTLFD